ASDGLLSEIEAKVLLAEAPRDLRAPRPAEHAHASAVCGVDLRRRYVSAIDVPLANFKRPQIRLQACERGCFGQVRGSDCASPNDPCIKIKRNVALVPVESLALRLSPVTHLWIGD